ncbi:MAG: hypothetical protein JWP44_523 [Mucilaginibacter sp.]|nr:hypothetical protein [Mucilaginibacter sp.]
MKKSVLPFIFLLFSSLYLKAQTPLAKNVNILIPAAIQLKVFNALDTLLTHIGQGSLDPNEIEHNGSSLSMSIFKWFKGVENNGKEKELHFYKPQIINLFPVDKNQYYVSVAFINNNALRAIINVIADVSDNKITFSIPVYYLTRNWRTVKTGTITYHYCDYINLKRAKKFNQKNILIAKKLGLEPEKLDFYLCDNYQQILNLLGCAYDSESAGITNDGLGVDEGTIFSIMHNEDFSHDLFHYYAAKVRKNTRNSAAEEGVAYSWGNAYYTDQNGDMITQSQLVTVLKDYLQQHPGVSLLELFQKNPFIFYSQTKVRSLISSLICDEVERKKGSEGIKTLIDCGSGDDNYFASVNNLIGINPGNFNTRVMNLLIEYK